jgi:hypothetical protein
VKRLALLFVFAALAAAIPAAAGAGTGHCLPNGCPAPIGSPAGSGPGGILH